MKISKSFWFLILAFHNLPFFAFGQIDTSLIIAEIEISASRIREGSIGTQSTHWGKNQMNKINANNLAELLENETPVFIKSYGMGSLATSSVRGGSAGHTLVLWNGLPIQSPMLGLLDLSLLPLNASDEITFQKGGNSALWGSGAIGGVISLKNQPNFSNKLSTESTTQIGSFGWFDQQLTVDLGNENFQSSSKVFYSQADNDFTYSISPDLPEKTQTNAQLEQWNFVQDAYWKINKKDRFEIHFWHQNSNREIPPLTTQTRSLSRQDDISTRILTNWLHIDNQIVTNLKIGFFDEDNNFFNDITKLEARNRFRSLIGEFNLEKNLRHNQKILFGSTHSMTKAWSDGYENPPVENRTALFASYKLANPKYQIQGSLRQEISNGIWVPLVPTLGANFTLHPMVNWQFKISKNYRLPTLNDRFWNPGGNEELLPESGWSAESTIHSEWNKNVFDFEVSVTGFNRLIKNQILWMPREGQPFWAAHNISRVWSRGLESWLSTSIQKNQWKLNLRTGYDFIRSSNQISLTLPKINKGEQIIYVPIHQFFGKISLTWHDLQVSYRHAFTSEVRGVNEDLTSYQIGDIRMQFSQKVGQMNGSIFLNINNLWDSEYFVVERRPMPGRHFRLGLNLRFVSN